MSLAQTCEWNPRFSLADREVSAAAGRVTVGCATVTGLCQTSDSEHRDGAR